MEEGDDQLENFEEEEYDEEGQVKKPGKKKKELSDYEKSFTLRCFDSNRD